jgi:hypothetical protein
MSRSFLLLATSVVLLAACASQPDKPPPPPSPQQLEKKFQEAAKGYKVVQKDGRTLYCRREKVLGSTIPTMQCLSEAQLRLQVENMEELRGRMRGSAKCTLGRDGGGGGCGGS